VLRHFTERQLRPLTVLTDNEDKLARFAAALREIGKRPSRA
jgi:hypothetical protein